MIDNAKTISADRQEKNTGQFEFVPADTGEAYWVMGTLFTYLVTGAESGGSYFTLIVDVGPEAGPPPHIHHLEEEQFYVLAGQLTYSVGHQTIQVNTGDFIHIPRGTVHSFKNGPRPSRLRSARNARRYCALIVSSDAAPTASPR